VTAVAPRQEGGTPWRRENPGEDRLRRAANHRSPGVRTFRTSQKPLEARPASTTSSREGPASLFGARPTQTVTWIRTGLWTTAPCGRRQERQEGQGMPRGIPAPERNEPLEGKPQERSRYETRPAGSRAEQGVKGLRKPGDAAQSGVVSPAPVAARFLKRCRGTDPRRVCPPARARCSARRARADERSDSGHTL
jgi:hypothetical protein